MDNRLDFFNYLNNYKSKLTSDDALLVLSHNKKDGDCITFLSGDWEILSSLFSIEGYVNFNEGNKEQFENIKNAILNTAFNICMTNSKIKSEFLKQLSKTNKLIVKADKNGYVNCPFCGKKHKHGKFGGNGHRIPDCNSPLINNPIFSSDGWHFKKDGYYVEFT